MPLSRRHALRLGAATAGLGVTGGLAGCSSVPLLGGSDYTAWLAEPGTVRDGADGYDFRQMDVAAVRNREDAFDENTYARYEEREESTLDLVGLDFDDADRFVSYRGVTVADASFERADVIDELGDEGFEEETDNGGYTIYAATNGFGAVGVGGGTLVFGGGDDAVDMVEAVIDTKNGEEDRYAAVNEAVELLVSTLDVGTFTRGFGFGDGDRSRAAQGRSVTVHGSATTIQAVVIYEDADVVDAEEVNAIEDADDDRDDIRHLSARKNGRVVTVSWDTDTDILGTDDYDGPGFTLGR